MALYIVGCVFGEDAEPHTLHDLLFSKFHAVNFQENTWIVSHWGIAQEIRGLFAMLGGNGERLIGRGGRGFVARVGSRDDLLLFEPLNVRSLQDLLDRPEAF